MTSLIEQDSFCCDNLDLVDICSLRNSSRKDILLYSKFKKDPTYIEVIDVYYHASWGGYQCYIECRPGKIKMRSLQALIIPLIKPKVSIQDPLIKEEYGLYAEDISRPRKSIPIIKSDRLKRSISYFFRCI